MFGGCPWDWSWAGRTSDFLRDLALQFLESDVSGQISSQTNRPSGKWNLPRIFVREVSPKLLDRILRFRIFFAYVICPDVFFLGVKFYLLYFLVAITTITEFSQHHLLGSWNDSLLHLQGGPLTVLSPLKMAENHRVTGVTSPWNRWSCGPLYS